MMISTSIIFSTGEKKCTPMNSAGRFDSPASEVIGRVEVFEPNTTFGPITASALAMRLRLDLAILEHRLDDQVDRRRARR